jgi:hypothetical protein
MGNGGDISNPPDRQERKYPRFKLRYPVHGKFYSGKAVSEFDAVSRNVSIGGLLLETASEIPRHSLLSFTMTIQGARIIHSIRLAGEGEVVRVEPSEPGPWFAIALACKHPIAQIENYLTTDTL